MENRSVEISRKKAQKQTGKSRQADWKSRDTNPAFFVRADTARPPTFPADILPDQRWLSPDLASTLIIPVALRAVTAEPVLLKSTSRAAKAKPKAKKAAKPALAKSASTKPVARKARVAKPRVKATPLPKTAARKPLSAALTPQPITDTTVIVPIRPVADTIPSHTPTPLPRARSVTVYRKNGVVDILGYWMRSRVSDLLKLFSPRPKSARPAPKMADLIAENTALRQEIARLRALT
ncbi:hypothetical protein [Sphingorhabdus sp.]|uniref:hypothetical protein n=1 Tax=Sphingorhabdus sp. TaxID=1902408 RepID=UPI0035939CC0